jgi:ribosomal protein S11
MHCDLINLVLILILIYLSTAIGWTPGGSTHLHTNNTWNITINNKTTQITNKTTQITIWKSAGCAQFL